MNKLILVVLTLVTTAAFAQAPTRVRGTITAVDGDVLSVKSRDGSDLKVQLAPDGRVATSKAISLADIKPGTYLGVTAMKSGDGKLTAVEVHTIPPQAPAGHMPWDLQPGSTMTNANLSGTRGARAATRSRSSHRDGSHKILVPAGTPIVDLVPGRPPTSSAAKPSSTIGKPDAGGVISGGRRHREQGRRQAAAMKRLVFPRVDSRQRGRCCADPRSRDGRGVRRQGPDRERCRQHSSRRQDRDRVHATDRARRHQARRFPRRHVGEAADGKLVAYEVRRFPKPLNPGHRPFDGRDDQTMTNATVSATVEADASAAAS